MKNINSTKKCLHTFSQQSLVFNISINFETNYSSLRWTLSNTIETFQKDKQNQHEWIMHSDDRWRHNQLFLLSLLKSKVPDITSKRNLIQVAPPIKLKSPRAIRHPKKKTEGKKRREADVITDRIRVSNVSKRSRVTPNIPSWWTRSTSAQTRKMRSNGPRPRYNQGFGLIGIDSHVPRVTPKTDTC